jgi:hypothetical protein
MVQNEVLRTINIGEKVLGEKDTESGKASSKNVLGRTHH